MRRRHFLVLNISECYPKNPHFTRQADILEYNCQALCERKTKKFDHRLPIYGMGEASYLYVQLGYAVAEKFGATYLALALAILEARSHRSLVNDYRSKFQKRYRMKK